MNETKCFLFQDCLAVKKQSFKSKLDVIKSSQSSQSQMTATIHFHQNLFFISRIISIIMFSFINLMIKFFGKQCDTYKCMITYIMLKQDFYMIQSSLILFLYCTYSLVYISLGDGGICLFVTVRRCVLLYVFRDKESLQSE